MACACKGRKKAIFVWTDGKKTVTYGSEIEAKAKVIRKGGSYVRKDAP